MTHAVPEENADTSTSLLEEWLQRLQELTARVRAWSAELGWSTRMIQKKMNDSRLGRYEAPALVIQKDAVRVLLDPVARFAPGTEGIADLYLMPGYDDIATLYFIDGEWRLHHLSSEDQSTSANGLAHRPLTKQMLVELLDEITAHVPEPL